MERTRDPVFFSWLTSWEEEYPPKKPNLSAGPALHQWEDVADCTLCVPSIPPAGGCWFLRPLTGRLGFGSFSFLEAFERYLVLVFRLLVLCILFFWGGAV